MSKPTRAVLRNVQGEHLATLTQEETDFYEALAEEGKVIRSSKMKKGRLCLIFRFKAGFELPAVPSLSAESSCSLTDNDSEGLAGCGGQITRGQRERWMGWGLIPIKVWS